MSRVRAVAWAVQVLVLAISALFVSGSPLAARGPRMQARTAPSAVVGTVLATRLAPLGREQIQRQRTHAVIDRDAFEADVADEDIDERDDDREAAPVSTEAAVLLRRRSHAPPEAAVTMPARDPSRLALGRGFSRGPPALA